MSRLPRGVVEGVAFAREVAGEFSADDCTSMAAALAYYTVFSLAPLLVIVTFVAGLVITPEEASVLVHGQALQLLGEEGADQVVTMVDAVHNAKRTGLLARIIGVVALLVGATGAVGQVQHALDRVFNVEPPPARGRLRRLLMGRLVALVLLIAAAALLVGSVAGAAVLSAIGDTSASLLPDGVSLPVMQAFEFGLTTLITCCGFGLLFKFGPHVRVAFRDVVVGALVTGVLFSLGRWGLGLYLGYSDLLTGYGAASSLALLFVWVYYSAIVLMFGAEFTQVWARRYGAGHRPSEGAKQAPPGAAEATAIR